MNDLQKSHQQEVRHLQDKLKEQARVAKERADGQEQVISELKQDCYNM